MKSRWMVRIGAVLLILVAVAGAATLLVQRTKAATSCVVDAANGQYRTIQSAVNAGCNEIQVNPGTYVEQVYIYRNPDSYVHIYGQGGNTIIKHPAPNGGTQQIDGADYVVALLQPDSHIENVVIDGGSYSCVQQNTCQAGQLYGIDEHGASNNTFNNIAFRNFGSLNSGYYDGNAFGLNTSGDNFYYNHKQDYRTSIYSNTFDAFTHSAIRVRTEGGVWGNFANIYFGNNQVNGRAGTIGFGNVPHQSVLENNTFTNFSKGGNNSDPYAGTAVYIGNDDKECINVQYVRQNTFTNNDNGVVIAGSNNQSVTIANTFNGGGTAIKLVGNLSDYTPYLGGNNPIDCKATHATRMEPIFFRPALAQWQYYPIRQDIINNAITNQTGDGILICSDNYVTVSGNGIANVNGSDIKICNGSSNNLVLKNQGTKITDQSNGGNTLGTGNYYSGNTCTSSTPNGLCGYTNAANGIGKASDPNWYISLGNCTWFNGNNWGLNPDPCSQANTSPGNTPPTVPCPNGFTCADIGNPGPVPGSTSTFNGVFTVNGGGDIGGTSDALQFAYQNLSVNGNVSARVISQNNADGSAKAGVMLRTSTDPKAPFYYAAITPTNGLIVLYRTASGANVTTAVTGAGGMPLYIRVRVAGGSYAADTSPDGQNWNVVPGSTVSLPFATPLLAGLAVSGHVLGGLDTAAFDHVSTQIVAGACPNGYTCGDVGAPGQAGSTAFANGTFSVTGSGVDIWGTADQFQYASQPLAGDGTLSAHLTSQGNTDPYAKAGVMFRQSTAANAPFYFAALTPAHGLLIQYRTAAGLAAQEAIGIPGNAPIFLRITRTGQSFATATSLDGTNWTLVNGSTVTNAGMTGAVLAGLAVTAHTNATTSNVTFDTVSLTTTIPPPPPPTGTCATGWTCNDIGAPVQAGSGSLSNGTWTVIGGGADIWGTGDQFQYVNQSLAGDGSISARVTGQTNTDPWAKAGVMFRQGTAANAPYYFAALTPTNNFVVQYRTASGLAAQQVMTLPGNTPLYLRVTRAGQAYSTYTSTDGTTWTLVNNSTVSLPLAGSMLAGLAVTAHTNAATSTATFDTVAVATTIPPPTGTCATGWTCNDIGAPVQAGSGSLSNGTWTVIGGGADIWGTGDQFQYVNQSLAGDGSITAHLTSQSNTDPYAKAGVMFRQSTAANAPFYFAALTPAHGLLIQYRTAAGLAAQEAVGIPANAPISLKITRAGQSFSTYTSLDGTNWTLIANSTVALPGMTGANLVGMVVTAHNTAVTSTTTFDTVAVAGPVAATTCTTGWTCGDVGAVGLTGTSTLSNGTWTVIGGGTDIWGANDQFQYASKALPGDGSLAARLLSQTNTDPYAKAGVMFRQGAAANAPFYLAAITPGHGLLIQYRTATGLNAQEAVGVPGTPPVYLKITRVGQTFSTSTSTDGITWTLVANSTVTINSLVGTLQAGLAASAHNNAVTSTVVFDSVNVP